MNIEIKKVNVEVGDVNVENAEKLSYKKIQIQLVEKK